MNEWISAEDREQIIRKVIRMAYPTWPWGWFDICPLNHMRDTLGASDDNQAYRLLSSFHCWDYYQIPRAIRKRLPELIREALAVGGKGIVAADIDSLRQAGILIESRFSSQADTEGKHDDQA